MNRRYLAPAAIAALLHVGLLGLGRSAPASAALGTFYPDGGWDFEPPPSLAVRSDSDLDGTARKEVIAADIEVTRHLAMPDDFAVDVLAVPPLRLPIGCHLYFEPGSLPSNVGFVSSRPYVYAAGDLDRPPRALSQAVPIYPYEERLAGVAGQVLVEFTVDERGEVIEPRVRESSSAAYAKSALAAVAHWKFEPGRRAGEVVRYRLTVPIIFTLTDPS